LFSAVPVGARVVVEDGRAVVVVVEVDPPPDGGLVVVVVVDWEALMVQSETTGSCA
jgi:pyruvate kinase